MTSIGDVRITATQNSDYPGGTPWPWTARLEEFDGHDWIEQAAEDGGTRDEAIDCLRMPLPTRDELWRAGA